MARAPSALGSGWGTPTLAATKIVRTRCGRNGIVLYVHRGIAPLVVRLVADLEKVQGRPFNQYGCWGYARRSVAGTAVYSFHAYGLAIDLEAPRHPQYRRGTWGGREGQVRYVAGKYGFQWGGVWSRPDEMHFEFHGSAAQAARLIAGLSGPVQTVPIPAPRPKPPASQPPHEEDDDVFSYIRHPNGAIARIHGNTWVVLTLDEWKLDQDLAKLSGRPVTAAQVTADQWQDLTAARFKTRA
jgi:hypothetical protein